MTERPIIEAAAELRRRRESYLIATVVDTRGSVYRRPGARMLLTQFRWIAGAVSGGCLEADIARRGWWHTRNGAPIVLSYDSRVSEEADDDVVRAAFGVGCDGVVDVLIERAGVPGRLDPLALAERCLRGGIGGVVATVIGGTTIPVGARIAWCGGDEPVGDFPAGPLRDAVIADARAALARGESCSRWYTGAGVFIEVIVPPPRLFVLGTGHDAVPVARLARTLGWDVVVCGRTARVAIRDRFVGIEVMFGRPHELAARIDARDPAVSVVMAHDYNVDREHVAMLLATRAYYIGVLGPRARTTRMFAELGLGLYEDSRIHAPVGLELGAETPDEVALAIVAEIQAVLRRAPATSLRDHLGPIHHRPLVATR
jgi:xanthine dehydrogenase accessory factor